MSGTIAAVLLHELEDLACGSGRWRGRKEPHVARVALRALDRAVVACSGGIMDPIFEDLVSKGFVLCDRPVAARNARSSQRDMSEEAEADAEPLPLLDVQDEMDPLNTASVS